MLKTYLFPIFATLLSIILGAMIVLLIPTIRYTQYIEPIRIEISPTNARNEMIKSGTGNFLFFDVRSLKEYDELHANDSKSVPIAELYDLWRKDLPRSKDKQIYLICTSGRLASVAYDFLEHHWYRNIKHIEWWIQQWIEENQPVTAKSIFTK